MKAVEPFVQSLADYLRAAHQQMRAAVQDLDAAALNWTPGPETNSIATLVVHSLGSEGETLRVVRGLPSDRDREAEFRTRVSSVQELLRRIDEADALLEESVAAITGEDLQAVRTRPGRPPQSGLSWLLRAFGHLREHLAHLELTKQLYRQQQGAAAAG